MLCAKLLFAEMSQSVCKCSAQDCDEERGERCMGMSYCMQMADCMQMASSSSLAAVDATVTAAQAFVLHECESLRGSPEARAHVFKV